MFKHKLIVVGTLVGYDDWWVMPCSRLKADPLSANRVDLKGKGVRRGSGGGPEGSGGGPEGVRRGSGGGP
eukprot:513806-Prorocentrum_minimum.AAC.1